MINQVRIELQDVSHFLVGDSRSVCSSGQKTVEKLDQEIDGTLALQHLRAVNGWGSFEKPLERAFDPLFQQVDNVTFDADDFFAIFGESTERLETGLPEL